MKFKVKMLEIVHKKLVAAMPEELVVLVNKIRELAKSDSALSRQARSVASGAKLVVAKAVGGLKNKIQGQAIANKKQDKKVATAKPTKAPVTQAPQAKEEEPPVVPKRIVPCPELNGDKAFESKKYGDFWVDFQCGQKPFSQEVYGNAATVDGYVWRPTPTGLTCNDMYWQVQENVCLLAFEKVRVW